MPQIPAEMTFEVDQQVEINASAEKAFDAVLHHLTDEFGTPGEKTMKLTLEPWPGGRWFRDLGDHQGHFWGHVQVLKRPSLIEICGPMFMSCPVSSHLQVRLTPQGDKTVLRLRHRAVGLIEEQHREGVSQGWAGIVQAMKSRAERR
jgi:hypothetical protein